MPTTMLCIVQIAFHGGISTDCFPLLLALLTQTCIDGCNYSGMLISPPITILYSGKKNNR
ncbi:MAG: hypothetical protein EF813_11815 [Methanosarcinales archaeon]|nr:MAG: hypothetical protein EF813_11815 [Methanosarcinales archaeon]